MDRQPDTSSRNCWRCDPSESVQHPSSNSIRPRPNPYTRKRNHARSSRMQAPRHAPVRTGSVAVAPLPVPPAPSAPPPACRPIRNQPGQPPDTQTRKPPIAGGFRCRSEERFIQQQALERGSTCA
jgi:hypothetical protein